MTSLTARFAGIAASGTVPVILAVGTVMPASACTTHQAGGAAGSAAPPAASAERSGPASARSARLPSYSHVVVVMEENHSYSEIIGSSQAPYINSLASKGALFTNSHAITHPSEPNYMAMSSGAPYGLSSDAARSAPPRPTSAPS